MTVYGFLYNDCVYESSWSTISIHRNRKNAKKALWDHMKGAFLEHKKYKAYCQVDGVDRPNFGWSQDWCIQEIEVLP